MATALSDYMTMIRLEFLDEQGEPRHCNSGFSAYCRKTRDGSIMTTYHVEDPLYAKRYALTGEYGIKLCYHVPLDKGGGAHHTVYLAETAAVDKDAVRLLAARTKKEKIVLDEISGFAELVNVEHATSVAFGVEARYCGRDACISRLWLLIPPAAEVEMVAQLQKLQKQLGGV